MSEFDRKHTLMREDISAFNPLEFGPSGSQTTLETTIEEIGDTPAVMIITPGVWTIDNSMQVPANIKLHIAQDAIIRVNFDQVLTLSGGYIVDGLRAFDADGVLTGHIEFDRIIAVGIVPEHWGIDNTGTIANNILWAEVLRAATTTVIHPILVNGIYKLDDATNPAISLLNHTQLRGNMRRANPSTSPPLQHSSRFDYYGTGDAISMVDTGSSYSNLVIENIYINDALLTGNHGMLLIRPQSLTMRNVYIHGFAHGITVNSGWYYGRTEQLKLRNYRLTGLIVSDNLNGNDLDLHCHSVSTTVSYHFALGVTEEGGAGGQCNDNRIFALIEPASGQAARITRSRGGEMNIYMEPIGGSDAANFAAQAISLEMSAGLTIQVFGNLKTRYNTGIFVSGTEAVNYKATHRINLSGFLIGSISNDLYVEGGPIYAIDPTGFSGEKVNIVGVGTGGYMLGDRYFTTGHRQPVVNEGRGSTTHLRNWLVGDVVDVYTALPGKNSRIICTTEGNPGKWIGMSPRPGFTAITTTPYSITTAVIESSFSNTGAAVIVTLELPGTTSGAFSGNARYRFLRSNPTNPSLAMRIVPAQNGVDTIRGAPGVNRYIQLDSEGTFIELENSGNIWELVGQRGTISYQAP